MPSRRAALPLVLALEHGDLAPARSYWTTIHEAEQRRGEVAMLKRENERMRARRAALQGSSATEREARRLGMVKPGEHPYVIEHLPKGP